MRNPILKNNKISSEDFYLATFLISFFFFAFPGTIYIAMKNMNCDFGCEFILSFFYSTVFIIFGMGINYLIIKNLKFIKRFLFKRIDGNKKEIVLTFILGSFYVYIYLFFLLIMNVIKISYYYFDKELKNLVKDF